MRQNNEVTDGVNFRVEVERFTHMMQKIDIRSILRQTHQNSDDAKKMAPCQRYFQCKFSY